MCKPLGDGNQGIYKITCLANGHFYIGRTVNFSKRRTDHLRDLMRGLHKNARLQACFDKYGLDYFHFDLVQVMPACQQIEAEQALIDSNISQDSCMNLNQSALTCDMPWTQERRQKISAAAIGRKLPPRSLESRQRTSEALKGHKLSAETRDKIATAHRGKKLTEQHKRKSACPGKRNGMFGRTGSTHPTSKAIEQLDRITGEVIARYGSAREAGRAIGCCGSHIAKAARSDLEHAKGFDWRYV